MTPGLTIIDGRTLRGVLGPPTVISKALLEDLVDFVELSAPEVVKATEARVTEADRQKSWLSAEDLERRLKALKARRKSAK